LAHAFPAAFSDFIASRTPENFFAATAPRIEAPKSTDSFSLGSIIGHPAKKKLNSQIREERIWRGDCRKRRLTDDICMFLDIQGVFCKSATSKKSVDLIHGKSIYYRHPITY
jgi:hypothetical protein